MSQQFCLKWNNHTTNMLQVFENLLTTEALVDVTLACDGLSLKAHKMVLSACSPFFQSLFLENPCKHPIVIMKDMRYCDLKAIIDFMYRGEVNVSHDQLSALLKTAETLKVKGLAEVTGENKQASGIVQHEIIQQNASTPTPIAIAPSAQRTDTPPLQGKRKRGRPRKRSLSDSNRSDDEGVPPKIKETNSDIEELSGDASMEATSDNRSSGGPISCNSQSQVPIHSSNNVNTFSKSHLSSSLDPQDEEPASGDENEFEVEPSKLLEQTLTTENVPSNSHNSTGPITLPSVSGLEISRRSMSSTDSGSQALVPVSIPSDSLGSNVQGPDSPQDVKPQILSFDDPPISPVAGTSHGSDRSLMMYMDQSGVASIPGPSNFQDNSALVPHDSQPQVTARYGKKYGKQTREDQWKCGPGGEVAMKIKAKKAKKVVKEIALEDEEPMTDEEEATTTEDATVEEMEEGISMTEKVRETVAVKEAMAKANTKVKGKYDKKYGKQTTEDQWEWSPDGEVAMQIKANKVVEEIVLEDEESKTDEVEAARTEDAAVEEMEEGISMTEKVRETVAVKEHMAKSKKFNKDNANQSDFVIDKSKFVVRYDGCINKSLLKFKCNQCDYAGRTKGNLNSHMFTHSNEYPFHCPLCEYKGKRHQNLKNHLIHKHHNYFNMDLLRTPDPEYYKRQTRSQR